MVGGHYFCQHWLESLFLFTIGPNFVSYLKNYGIKRWWEGWGIIFVTIGSRHGAFVGFYILFSVSIGTFHDALLYHKEEIFKLFVISYLLLLLFFVNIRCINIYIFYFSTKTFTEHYISMVEDALYLSLGSSSQFSRCIIFSDPTKGLGYGMQLFILSG